MDNEMTVRDFYEECVNFKYSDECFQLMKECAEIQLQQRYLLNEAHLIFGECGSEEYLVEAAKKDPEKTSNFVGKLNNYRANVSIVVTKVLTMIRTMIGKFIIFLKKAIAKFFRSKNATEEAVSILKKCNITKDDVWKIIDVFKDADLPAGLMDMEQPKLSGIKFPSGVNDIQKNIISAALSTSYIRLYPFKDHGNNTSHIKGAFNLNLLKADLKEIIKIVKSNKKMNMYFTDEGNYKYAISAINNHKIITRNDDFLKSSYTAIDIDVSQLDNTIKDFQEIFDEFQSVLTDLNRYNPPHKYNANTKDLSRYDQPYKYNDNTVEVLQYMLQTHKDNIAAYIASISEFLNWRQSIAPKLLEVAKEIYANQKNPTGNDSNVNESVNNNIDILISFMFE